MIGRWIMNNLDNDKEAKPGVIAYRTVPSDKELMTESGRAPDGSTIPFRPGTRFYPTPPTARSLRKGSATGETITYYTKTKMLYPVLWFDTEGARKAGLGAPALTIDIKEKDLHRALNEPHKWEMLCPSVRKGSNSRLF